MPTIPFDDLVRDVAAGEPAFRTELFRGALEYALRGETEEARRALRLVVNTTVGFAALARETGIGEKSLMRMLSKDGNPRMTNFLAIVAALGRLLGIETEIAFQERRISA